MNFFIKIYKLKIFFVKNLNFPIKITCDNLQVIVMSFENVDM